MKIASLSQTREVTMYIEHIKDTRKNPVVVGHFLLLEKYIEKQKTGTVFQDNLLHRSVHHFSILQQQ